MFRLFKTPTYFTTTAFHRGSHHVGTTANHCRKLSTAQRSLISVSMSNHSSGIRLHELDEMWTTHFRALEDRWSKRLAEADSLCLKLSQALENLRSECLHGQQKENGYPSCLARNRQHAEEKRVSIETLKDILVMRAAIANVVSRGKLAGKICPAAGTQEALDGLAKREEFTTILEAEAEKCGLSVKNIMASFNRLDSLVSKPLALDGLNITVPHEGFTDAERAALVTLFTLQEDWSDNFWGREMYDGGYNSYGDYSD